MAVLTVQNTVGTTGVAATFAAAASAGDKFANDGKTQFVVKSGTSVARTVTISSKKTCNQGSTHDLSVSVVAGAQEVIGPFDRSRFNNGAGQVEVTYSSPAGLTVAALKTQA